MEMSKRIGLIFCFIFVQNVLCSEQISLDTNEQMIINEDLNWSLKNLENFDFKQIPGVAFNKSILTIFHRSTVVWDQNSFSYNEIYLHQDQPILVDPILNFNKSGNFISSWGKNTFFMPHGLSFDSDYNIWLTDVALHQVFRYDKNNLKKPDLILGERFVPGSDLKHFCKPTDVQVSNKKRLVYISDGYCNSRIMIFTYDGKFVKQIGQNENMIVPHSLSLIEELDLICVADRERGRALCYNAGIQNELKMGELRKELSFSTFNSQLFAIQNIGTHLFGALILNNAVKGLLYDLTKDKDELIWHGSLSLRMPHDLTVDNNNNLYISEIGSNANKLLKRYKINLVQNDHLIVQQKEHSEQDSRPKSKRIDVPLQGEYMKLKSKRVDDTKVQEEDLKNLATTTTEANVQHIKASTDEKLKSKKSSLLIFILFISSLLLISIILFVLKKRIGIENYFRSLGFSGKVIFSKDSYINDPERQGFNRLSREEEENLFDFEMDNNSSDSEVEQFNFKHVRKV